MRLIDAIPGTARAWWLGFGLLVGIPVSILAVLGLRMVDLERVQRREQIAEQQGQTALLVDASIAATLNRIDHELAQSGPEGATGGTPFTIDGAGSLALPRDKVYFADIGAEPVRKQVEFSPGVRDEIDLAMLAEARGNATEAMLCYERLAQDARLKAWATLALARMMMRQRPEALLEWAHAEIEDAHALSPAGTPVALIAAGYEEELPATRRADYTRFLNATLMRLRSGEWWLSYQQRKLEDAELCRLLSLATGREPPPDPRIAEIGGVERAITLARRRRELATRALIPGPEPLLVVSVPDAREKDDWKGAVFSSSQIRALLSPALARIGASVSYPLALRCGGRLLWSAGGPIKNSRVFPVSAVIGWELAAGDPRSENGARRTLFWYCFIALLIIVLSLALIMTMRVIGREMELARLQTEFAAGVTHEFKSPITSIRLLVERIARGHVVAADSLHEYAAIIDDQAARLEQLVNRLLQAHKMHAANESYHIVPHCLFDIAQNAIERLNAQASAKRIAVHLDADDIAREVPLDGAAIQDSLQNLIDNAIKYSPPDTAIEVKIRHAQDQVSIVVSDRGVGIDKQDLPRVFDRFYRARRGSRQSVTGTGLGLWLVKRAAEGHGGRVDVQSQPGAGSVFCVTIPIHREEEWPES